MHTCMHTHPHAHMYAYTHACTHMHSHMHACMHTSTPTNIHTLNISPHPPPLFMKFGGPPKEGILITSLDPPLHWFDKVTFAEDIPLILWKRRPSEARWVVLCGHVWGMWVVLCWHVWGAPGKGLCQEQVVQWRGRGCDILHSNTLMTSYNNRDYVRKCCNVQNHAFLYFFLCAILTYFVRDFYVLTKYKPIDAKIAHSLPK